LVGGGQKSARLGKNFCVSSAFGAARRAESLEKTSIFASRFSSIPDLETSRDFRVDEFAKRVE